jgi:hypothetical protein
MKEKQFHEFCKLVALTNLQNLFVFKKVIVRIDEYMYLSRLDTFPRTTDTFSRAFIALCAQLHEEGPVSGVMEPKEAMERPWLYGCN